MMFNQEFIELLSVSSLRMSKLLYSYAILFTPLLFLNLFPSLYRNHLFIVIYGLYSLILLILSIVGMFGLAPWINEELQFPGGLILPGGKVGKFIFTTLLILFFVWVSSLPIVITYWINPRILQSNTDGTGWGQAIFSLVAGSTEELWRWTFILSLFFLGTYYLPRMARQWVLGISLMISCVLFGVGHIGELNGYDGVTWVAMSVSGLLLFFFAYWGRSFWIAVLSHCLYDFIVFLGVIPMSWWTIMVVPWGVIAFFYYRWRRSVVLMHHTEQTDGDNRLSS